MVTLPAEQVHKELLLPGLAVYASPENLEKYSEIVIPENSIQYSSDTAQKQLPLVSKLVVPIVMCGDASERWLIEPWHIRIALRKYAGFYLSNDDCVKMPSEKVIQGPNSRYSSHVSFIRIRVHRQG